MSNKLAVVTSHPIQYYAPLFAFLNQRESLKLKVFYTWGEQAQKKIFDPGFGKTREWDVPLLTGYDYEFVKNTSLTPGSNHFNGIVNPDLIYTIKQYLPDAILIFGWAFHSHLQVLRYFKGKIPVLFRGDSTLLDETQGRSLKKLVRRIFLKWVYRHIDIALYVGTNNKKYFKAHGVKEYQLVSAPHAIDNDRFTDPNGKYEQQAKQWLSTLNISDGTRVVLFAGKFEAKKNPLLIIEAATKLPLMHFILVGNGLLEEDIKERATKLSNVTILPFQNQSMMPIVYRLCDIFVLPSSGPGETWGLAINEAMACGRVVVATEKCGGAVDLIEDGENGYLISSNSKSLIQALEILQKEKNLVKRLKSVSLEKVKLFSFNHLAIAIETVLHLSLKENN